MYNNLNYFGMKKIILIIIIATFTNAIKAQSLPGSRYFLPKFLLDMTNKNPSFAYSLRKLNRNYFGFAVKIRRSSDNAEANVNFDDSNVVSANSNVIITAIGTSSFSLGQSVSYATFLASNTIFVTTWYDQGSNSYHATQTNTLIQPKLVLNSAGSSNTLPSILFNGTNKEYLAVGQPIENLVNNGINGSILLVLKPTQNSDQLSFGMHTSADWRWSLHINWSNSNTYFDASEICCAPNRYFLNNTSINVFKQYSFLRGNAYKTVRLNTIPTTLNNSAATSSTMTGGDFYLGFWYGIAGGGNYGYYGNATEIVLFKTDLSTTEIAPLELNQMFFWGL